MADYKFSVIIPVFNMEDYIEEAIRSVINQSIGFLDNIQLILVNDGSTDNSRNLCDKYRVLYPNNVVFIEQENQGVSVARNVGMEHAKGKYVTFLDGDDIWEKNAFRIVDAFFSKNDVGIVACRMKMFGKKEGFSHPLDYKFTEDRVVDIINDYKYPQLHMSTFFKNETIKGRYFNTELKNSEDMAFISEILVDEGKYGIVCNAIYYYRKRIGGDSAVDTKSKKKTWYLDTTEKAYKRAFDLSEEKYGEVLPYFQYAVMYDLGWRFEEDNINILTNEEKKEYLRVIYELLKKIEDRIIIEQIYMDIAYKLYALSLKRNKDIRDELKIEDGKLILETGQIVWDVFSNKNIKIKIFEEENEHLLVEGFSRFNVLGEKYNLKVIDSNGRQFEGEKYEIEYQRKRAFNDEVVYKEMAFKFKLPISKGIAYKIALFEKEKEIHAYHPSFGKMAKLNNHVKGSYYVSGEHLFKYRNEWIKIEKGTLSNVLKHEIKYEIRLFQKKKFSAFGLLFYRVSAIIAKARKSKEIWIVSDRTVFAGDNGEAFFSYIYKNNLEGKRKIFFLLDNISKDYYRIGKIGPVVHNGSLRYKLLFLKSNIIISSQADNWVTDAFNEKRVYVKDLYNFKFVFLQHGITKDNQSSWLHKQNKNIKLLSTAAEPEYKAFIRGRYAYSESEVKLTGFARYDLLKNDSKKKIAFLPTWRMWLASPERAGTSERDYNEEFKNSDYCRMYNTLINDERLLDFMKKNGYTGEFYVHPAILNQAQDFVGNDTIKVINSSADYNTVFRENALMITDYSSVAFDFCYMKKPVIYYQADRELFFENHLYTEGYYDYERDGFGPVVYSNDEVVDAIIDIIENDCDMEEKYKNRVQSFFKYSDTSNCERLLKCIEQL